MDFSINDNKRKKFLEVEEEEQRKKEKRRRNRGGAARRRGEDCGCTNPAALNYSAQAIYDDGSCCFTGGCTSRDAANYDPNACVDDGSCIYPTNTVYDIVANSVDHTTLKVAVDTCSLDGTLSGPGPFTLFAPTDAAFNALPAGTVPASPSQ